jgi:hypothetical protein
VRSWIETAITAVFGRGRGRGRRSVWVGVGGYVAASGCVKGVVVSSLRSGFVEVVGESAARCAGEITCRFEGATFGLGGEWSIKG